MDVRELLGLDMVSFSVNRRRLKLFRHVEHKDDADWLKRCMKLETDGTWPSFLGDIVSRRIWSLVYPVRTLRTGITGG